MPATVSQAEPFHVFGAIGDEDISHWVAKIQTMRHSNVFPKNLILRAPMENLEMFVRLLILVHASTGTYAGEFGVL